MNAKTGKLNTAAMTQIALCVAALSASSYLVIPLPFTPIVLSLHTVMVNLIGLVLKPKQATYTLLIYLAMGLVGLPVFSGGAGGPGKLLGPTGGFYFGFLFAVIAISLLKGSTNRLVRYIIVTIAIGLPVEHLFAVGMMCFHNGFDVRAAALSVSLPFVPGDILKCVISSMIAVPLNKALRSGKNTYV